MGRADRALGLCGNPLNQEIKLSAPKLRDELAQQALDFATAHGSCAAGARAMGIPETTFKARLKAAWQRNMTPGAQAIPQLAAIPEGYALKGTSTLYNGDGSVQSQWVKTMPSLEKLQALQRAALDGMLIELKPIERIKAPKTTIADLLNLYTITDFHIGMLAWDKETGADWDLEIAERVLADTFIRMIDAAPAAKTGIVNQLGDFLHFDSLQPLTPTNHHVLDADSRYQKVVQTAVRVLRRIVDHALTKHESVQVYMHEGNHDPAGSVWLRVLFAALYEKNPRIKVGMSPLPYVAYLHGKTLLGFHHGHMTKLANLPQIFAAKFREEWGTSTHTYIHTGHKHHVEEKEHPGVNVVQHATLAAADAYAARGGWISKRQATSMTYHTERGEIARGIFVPGE